MSSAGMVVFLAVTILLGCGGPAEESPQIKQLEQEVATYAAQLDSLNKVVDDYDARVKDLRSQLYTAQAANRTLVTALQKAGVATQEYRRLYGEQQALNKQLQGEVQKLRTERDRSIAQAQQLRNRVAGMDTELNIQRNRVARLEASLQASLKREAEAVKAVTSVFVYAGKEQSLEEQGFLQVKQTTILTNSYKVVRYPDVQDKQRVKRASVGETLTLNGHVRYLVDQHGKLKRDRSYRMERSADGKTTQITFLEPILEGQRVLAVVR